MFNVQLILMLKIIILQLIENFERKSVVHFAPDETKLSTSLTCRSIRIGTYKFESTEKVCVIRDLSIYISSCNYHLQVEITNKGIRIFAPNYKNSAEIYPLDIQNSEIVKIITHFSKQLQIVFIYTKPSCARYILTQLQLTQVNDRCKMNSLNKNLIFIQLL